jgi:hypothetical protein
MQSQPSGEGVRKLKTRIAKKMKLSCGTVSCGRGNRTELDRYLAEGREDDNKKLDILDWWKRQSTRFPFFSTMLMMCSPSQSSQLLVKLPLAQVGVF